MRSLCCVVKGLWPANRWKKHLKVNYWPCEVVVGSVRGDGLQNVALHHLYCSIVSA